MKFLSTAFLITLFGFTSFLAKPSVLAQESLLALGKVSSGGTLRSSVSRPGVSVIASRLAAGSYEVSIIQLGGFAGSGSADYVVEAGIESALSSDTGITARIVSVSDDVIVVGFRTADLEVSASPDDPVAVDQPFCFAIRESADSSTMAGDSRHLLAVGIVDESSSVASALGVGGIQVRSLRAATGLTELFLEKPGAFVGDTADDYLIFLTALAGGTEDEMARGDVKSTLLDSSVTFTLRNDDVQATPAGNAGTPANGDIGFAIYRIDGADGAGPPSSRLILMTASVAGDDGSKVNGSASSPGAVVITSRSDVGVYHVRLVPSSGYLAGSVVPVVTVRGDIADRAATAVVEGDQITVRIKDLQTSGQSEGVPVDNDFDLVVYSTEAAFAHDLAIGARNNPATFKHFGVIAGGPYVEGQDLVLKLQSSRRHRYFFASENTARSIDGLRLERSNFNGMFADFFNLTGGRINVTAVVRTGGIAATEVRPGQRVVFEGGVRFRNANRRFSNMMFIRGNSEFASRGSNDLIRLRARPR